MILIALLLAVAAVFLMFAAYVVATRETTPTYRASEFLKQFPRCPVCRKVHVRVRDGLMESWQPCDAERVERLFGPPARRSAPPEETLIPDRRDVIPFAPPQLP